MSSFRRARFAAIVTAAFVGGVALASAFDFTGLGHAQSRTVSGPSRSQVRPLAESGQAFTAIAEAVTPAVVSIQAERDPRARPSQAPLRGRQGQGPGGQLPPGLEDLYQQF